MKLDHLFLKELDSVLEAVKECGATDCMVAGGAIRDMLLGKPIKDIDVFYYGVLDDAKTKKYFKLADKHLEDQKVINEYYKEEKSSWEIYADDVYMDTIEFPIQLIHVKTEKDYGLPGHIHTFGCNLSKALFNGHLCLSDGFLEDVWLKQLTFTDQLRTGNYKEKMMAKYPDYAVVDPYEEQHAGLNF